MLVTLLFFIKATSDKNLFFNKGNFHAPCHSCTAIYSSDLKDLVAFSVMTPIDINRLRRYTVLPLIIPAGIIIFLHFLLRELLEGGNY